MQIKRTFLGIAGVTALALGLGGGIASANDASVDSDSITTTLNVDCNQAATVKIFGNGAFAPMNGSTFQDSTQTGEGAIKVAVDMGCYTGGWSVDARISAFRDDDGDYAFSGDHFSLRDATVDYYFLDSVDTPADFLAPTANNAYFDHSYDTESDILETSNSWFFWWNDFDVPAPFVTTASYTGYLSDMGDVDLTDGAYSATLTVTLSLD